MIRLDDLQFFVHTVDSKSFSETARQLSLSPAFVSASIARLEKALGTRLFVRSTRSMQLSEEGADFLPHARATLAALARGQHQLETKRGGLSGTLRLSASSDLGRNVLLPWLDEFQHRHPALSLVVRLSDRATDLVREPVDVAIRYGVLADSGLLAIPLAPHNRRVLCAAPAYLERHGTPSHVDDLREHNCLRFIWSEQVHDRWRFMLPAGERTVVVSGNRVSDDADVVRRWALAGEGVVYKSRLDLVEDIAAGRLVEWLPQAYGEPVPLHLVCAHRAGITPLIVQLRDFLRARCQALLDTVPGSSPQES